MVRTRADNTARKAVAAKAPRKNYSSAGPSATSPTSAAKGNKHSGGNPYCPRPTPDWQKEITNFFIKKPKSDKENQDPEDEAAGASSSSMVADNTEDVPTSSKTTDKRKIKKSKVTTDQSDAGTSKDAPAEKMDDEAVATATGQPQDSEPMEVEIKIVDKKQDNDAADPTEKESPRAFQKNNCISDSDEDD